MSLSVLLIAIGAACLAAFAVVNIVVQPLWFPNEVTGARDANPIESRPASAGPHFVLGLFLAALFLVGTLLIVAGCVIIGTAKGYG